MKTREKEGRRAQKS